jgi:hypothetical protein
VLGLPLSSERLLNLLLLLLFSSKMGSVLNLRSRSIEKAADAGMEQTMGTFGFDSCD